MKRLAKLFAFLLLSVVILLIGVAIYLETRQATRSNCHGEGADRICGFVSEEDYSDDMSVIGDPLKEVVPFAYILRDLRENLAFYKEKQEGLWGIINADIKVVVPPKYKQVRDFSYGLAAVSIDDKKWGYIDGTGKWVIPPQFDFARNFSYAGLAAGVKKEGLYGFIDKKGDLIISPQYDEVNDSLDDYTKVKKDDLWICLNVATGEEVGSNASIYSLSCGY